MTRELIVTQGMLVNSAVVNAINIEWLLVLGVSLALFSLALLTWRIANRTHDKALAIQSARH